MNSLVREITRGLLEDSKRSIAVYGGGFKPPTRGHFEVVQTALKENPEIDEFIIYVGKGERDGITQEDSVKIWNIYARELPMKVSVEASTKPPIQAIYNVAKNNPQDEVLWVIGARDGNEEDFKDLATRTKSISKYPNLELRTIVTKGGVSGTAARNALTVSKEKFEKFIPDFLTDEEKNNIYVILTNKISEIGDLSQKPYKFTKLPSSKSSPYTYYKFITDNGTTYEVVFERDETDVATTYNMAFTAKDKDGGEFSSSALTGGNEPLKIMSTVVDITKKHIDKVDDADYIGFQPTKGKEGEEGGKNIRAKLYKLIIKKNFPGVEIIGDDDNILVDLEGYYDDVYEAIVGKKIQCDNCDWNWNIKDGGDDLYTCHKCWHDNTPKKQLNEEASFSQHIDYKSKINDLTQHMLRKGMNITPLPKVTYVHDEVENAKDFFGKTAYYDPNNLEIVLYTEGRHPKDIVRSFSHEMIHHIQNMEGRLGNVVTTNTTEDEHLNKIEAEANLKGTMTFRNWTDSVKKSGDKDPFGLNAIVRSIMEDETEQYKIYVDMDGVVADFDKRFTDLAGMSPEEFKAKQGTKGFWDFIDEENKIKFWVGIPPMPGASELINFVSKHDYEMLTAPSIKKQSRLGKNLWIRNHTGDIFPSKPRVNFKAAKEKHLIKPQLTKFDILIDDRAATIDNWNAAGGNGILYKSAPQVINTLKKLGL